VLGSPAGGAEGGAGCGCRAGGLWTTMQRGRRLATRNTCGGARHARCEGRWALRRICSERCCRARRRVKPTDGACTGAALVAQRGGGGAGEGGWYAVHRA
jgi:hypothetical protein